MLDNIQALKLLREALPNVPIKAWVSYHDLYLFRVEWPMPLEKDWDPFVSVDVVTGEIRDFSVLTDGNLSEISDLNWKNVEGVRTRRHLSNG